MGGRVVVRVLAVCALLAGLVAPAAIAPSSGAAPVGAATFVPLAPSRILDTRTGLGGSTPGDDSSIEVRVAGRGGVPASGAVDEANTTPALPDTPPADWYPESPDPTEAASPPPPDSLISTWDTVTGPTPNVSATEPGCQPAKPSDTCPPAPTPSTVAGLKYAASGSLGNTGGK